MGAFLGCCVIALVVGYWLRLVVRALIATGAVHEAALNRAAKNRGDKPISDDIDTSRLF